METINEEKSLVKVDNGIFSRIRRFFRNIFSRKDTSYYVEDNSNENTQKEPQYKVDEYTQPKLFNYDDPKNFYGKENTESNTVATEDSTVSNSFNNSETSNNNEDNFANVSTTESYNQETPTETQENVSAPEQNETQYIGISKYFEDVDENYIGKSKRQASEKRDDGYEGKEELEQKLMNYYASIKKAINN